MKLAIPNSVRLDAGENVFFARQLEHISAKTYDVQYPELRARRFLNVNNEVDTGVEKYTYRTYDTFGHAKVTKDYSGDIPRADVDGVENSVDIFASASSYGYSLQEIRNGRFAGVDLDAKKAAAARKIIEKQLDDLMLDGDSSKGILGLFALANTETYTVPAGASTFQNFARKTADEMKTDLHALARRIVTQSNGVEMPNMMIMPLSIYDIVGTQKMGDGDSRTVLKAFLENDPHIQRIDWSEKLETAGAGSVTRTVALNDDPMKVEFIIPQEFESIPPQERDFTFVVPCHARTAGCVAYYPKSICYADGF